MDESRKRKRDTNISNNITQPNRKRFKINDNDYNNMNINSNYNYKPYKTILCKFEFKEIGKSNCNKGKNCNFIHRDDKEALALFLQKAATTQNYQNKNIYQPQYTSSSFQSSFNQSSFNSQMINEHKQNDNLNLLNQKDIEIIHEINKQDCDLDKSGLSNFSKIKRNIISPLGLSQTISKYISFDIPSSFKNKKLENEDFMDKLIKPNINIKCMHFLDPIQKNADSELDNAIINIRKKLKELDMNIKQNNKRIQQNLNDNTKEIYQLKTAYLLLLEEILTNKKDNNILINKEIEILKNNLKLIRDLAKMVIQCDDHSILHGTSICNKLLNGKCELASKCPFGHDIEMAIFKNIQLNDITKLKQLLKFENLTNNNFWINNQIKYEKFKQERDKWQQKQINSLKYIDLITEK